MVGEIDSKKITVRKLFSDEFWFTVPEYQRSYVWERANVLDLVNDITLAYEEKETSEYFLGSLVLKKSEVSGLNDYDILDGQQRLTTLILAIAVLRDIVENKDYKGTLNNLIFAKGDELLGVPKRFKVNYKIRDDVKAFITEFITEENGTLSKDRLKQLTKESDLSISHMSNAVIVLNEAFLKLKKSKGNDWITSFIKFILTKIVFVYVATDNTEDAFRLFSILDARGIQLSRADIIKSENLACVPSNKIDYYAKKWEDLESKHGSKNFVPFLELVRFLVVKEPVIDGLNIALKKGLKKKLGLDLGEGTINLILNTDKIYTDIIDLKDKNLSVKTKNAIKIMKKCFTSSNSWMCPIIAYYDKFGLDFMDDFIKMVEYKYGCEFLRGVDQKERLDMTGAILKAISNEDDPLDVILNKDLFFVKNKDVLRKDLSDIRTKRPKNQPKFKYILLRYESVYWDKDIDLDEHIKIDTILPLTNNYYPESYLESIGNTLLINDRRRFSLDSNMYITRKAKYMTLGDTFKSTKMFLSSYNSDTEYIFIDRVNALLDCVLTEPELKNI